MTVSTATGTLVLDPATMAKALTALGNEIGSNRWLPGADGPNGALQRRFLDWYGQNREAVEALSNLETKVSDDAEVLNQFLTEHGFSPLFGEIHDGGIGAAAIIDMLVQWAVEASITNVQRLDGNRYVSHRAFEIPKAGVEFFEVAGQTCPLVRLATKDGTGVWLKMADRPADGLSLAETAVKAMADLRLADASQWSAVRVPTLEIDSEVQLDWMIGVANGDHYIEQAFQMFKLRMNEEGARVKVATGFATTRSITPGPRPLTFNQPFIGWFTQPGSSIPIAAFYADYDSWQEPAGSLEEL